MTIQFRDDLSAAQSDPDLERGTIAGRGLTRLPPGGGLTSSPLHVGGGIVFIDARVSDIQDLIAGVQPGMQVYVIDSDRDGLQQIASILASNHVRDLSAISIVSHGSVGQIEIGSTLLNDASLGQHSDMLASIGASLKPGGDLSLYACNVAQGALGHQFIADLSSFVGGADVAASTHNVGSANHGGSFVLDASTGAIDSAAPFSDSNLTAYDGNLAGTISGQLWNGLLDSPPVMGHINSDGSSPTHVGDEAGTNEIGPNQIGLDLAAGFYFQTNWADISSPAPESISSYRISDSSLINTVEIGNQAQIDQVNALAVDPLNHFVYVGRWGVDAAHSGIVKVSYNTTTGVLDSTAAALSSPTFVFTSATAGNDIRDIDLDVANQVLYFSVNNNNYNFAPFTQSNSIWKVNVNGTGLTQLSQTGGGAGQFPASTTTLSIGQIAVDVAKGLIYFETSNTTGTGLATLWYMPIAGGAATAMTIPGGLPLAYGDAQQGGLTLDVQAQQLYITTQDNGVGSGATEPDQILVGQLSADGHSITSIVHTYTFATLYSGAEQAGAHSVGSAFDVLPVLTISGTNTHAVEQSGLIVLPASESSSDVDSGNHYASATVQITGGKFSSNESTTVNDHLTINGATTGTVAGTSITLSYDSASETLTLTGYDTIAHYDAALALVKYNTTGDNPTNYGANTTRTITWTVSDGAPNIPNTEQNSGTTVLTVDGVNDASTLAGAGNTITYVEQAAGAVIDNAITVGDPDNLNQSSATVTISNNFQTGDTLNFTNQNGISGSYDSGTHVLTLSGSATLANYQTALRSVTFSNSTNNDPTAGGATTRTITWVANDGALDSNSVTTTINVTPVNDAPTLTATATTPSFQEAVGFGTQAAAVAMFSGAASSTIESGQTISGLTFTVSGLVDGANEKAVVDGTTFALTAGTNGTTATNGFGYTVAVAGGTATVVLTKGAGISTTLFNTLVNSISYQDTSTDDPTAGNRVFTLTQVKDNGGVLNSGVDAATLAIASTVTVVKVNDAPTLSVTASNPTFTEAAGLGTQAAAVGVYSGAASNTIEAGQTVTGLTFTVSGLVDGANEKASVDGTSFSLTDGTNGTTATNGFGYSVVVLSGTATVTLTKGAGISTGLFNTLVNSISYQDTNTDNPTVGDRVFTITHVTDNGGTAAGGIDTGDFSLASTVHVAGTNDPAVISGTILGSVTEASGVSNGTAGTPTASATLTDTDVDNTANSFQAVAAGAATTNGYGTYQMTAGGTWTYTINDNNAAVQALNTGGTLSDTFTVLAADGTSQLITITINGANDAAVISGTVAGDVTEASGVANGTAGTPTASATLTDTDVDNTTNSFQAVAAGAATTNGYGTYAMTAGGTWTYTLDDNNAAVQALNVGGTLSDTFTVLTADGTSQLVTVTIHGADDSAVAKDDDFVVNENATLTGQNLFADNSFGADSDVDGPALSVAAVNGSGPSVGNQITLASGAHLTVNADGTFTYDPTGAAGILAAHLAAPGSGAANTSYDDTFTYTLAGGGTATATVTVFGVNNANTIYEGTGGNNTITGDATLDGLYHLEQGGNDTVTGGSGTDGFYFGGAFTAADTVDGGAGSNDQIGLEGDYSGGLTLGASTITGIEVIALLPGFSYNLTTVDANVAAGQTLTIWATRLAASNTVTFNGSAENDGKFVVFGGAGNDTIIGGAGNDTFYGLGGADTMTGNGGSDTFVYSAASQSTGNANGTAYDTLVGFDAAVDKFHMPPTVTAIDGGQSGDLSSATFDTNLTAALGSGQLGANHAVLFTATSGTLNTHIFLVVDANGTAGYQSGADFVFDVTGGSNLGALATTAFI